MKMKWKSIVLFYFIFQATPVWSISPYFDSSSAHWNTSFAYGSPPMVGVQKSFLIQPTGSLFGDPPQIQNPCPPGYNPKIYVTPASFSGQNTNIPYSPSAPLLPLYGALATAYAVPQNATGSSITGWNTNVVVFLPTGAATLGNSLQNTNIWVMGVVTCCNPSDAACNAS
ncbi:MAG: hypothetical protein A3F13_02825 [Gammaproteobacteria bacterium RIFCSPHIGHO2_12_FULL_40_19]|nr:MAG: hypothetical protein A3F13_02825 [Gammaproteobacteria bacterium RIFCSPHIGHO2_12_FULL_40_19]